MTNARAANEALNMLNDALEVQVKPLSGEQINSAMFSSVEGFAFLVVDSIEFDLGRDLTDEESQQVCRVVESVISKGASHE